MLSNGPHFVIFRIFTQKTTFHTEKRQTKMKEVIDWNTDPVNKLLLAGTVPINKLLLTGTLSIVRRCWLATPRGAGVLLDLVSDSSVAIVAEL